MGEGDDAVDVSGKRLIAVTGGDQFGRMGGTVGRGDHGEVVAGAGAAVLARVPEEGGDFGGRGGDFAVSGWEFVVKSDFLKRHVVGMDVFSGRDGTGGAADALAVANEPVAGGNGAGGNLVAGGYGILALDASLRKFEGLAGREREAGDGDVVLRVQQDGGIPGGGECGDVYQAHAPIVDRAGYPAGGRL